MTQNKYIEAAVFYNVIFVFRFIYFFLYQYLICLVFVKVRQYMQLLICAISTRLLRLQILNIRCFDFSRRFALGFLKALSLIPRRSLKFTGKPQYRRDSKKTSPQNHRSQSLWSFEASEILNFFLHESRSAAGYPINRKSSQDRCFFPLLHLLPGEISLPDWSTRRKRRYLFNSLDPHPNQFSCLQ